MREIAIFGRLMFGAALFAGAAYTGWHADALAEQQMPAAWVVRAGAGALALGSFGVMLGLWPRLSIGLVASSLAVAAPLLHPFWSASTAATSGAQLVLFLAVLALAGAALALLALPRPWPGSVESVWNMRSGGHPPWSGMAVTGGRWRMPLMARLRRAALRGRHAFAALAKREDETSTVVDAPRRTVLRSMVYRAHVVPARRVSQTLHIRHDQGYVMFRGVRTLRTPLADGFG